MASVKWGFLTILIGALGLFGCSDSNLEAPFIPPTSAASIQQPAFLQPSPSPFLESTPPPIPSATPACSNQLTYLQDLTIPDGATVKPGEILDKRWRVQNSGTCNWNESYRLRLISGPDLGAPGEQALYPARSGTELTLRILFLAPAEAGSYRSAWQAYSPEGELFGDPIYIEFIVATTVP
jgi:hypothetical protein